jgi:hypothetical protein
MNLPQLREQYEQLRQKISPLPWVDDHHRHKGTEWHVVLAGDGEEVADAAVSDSPVDNAAYIAFAANNVEPLLAECERLASELRKAEHTHARRVAVSNELAGCQAQLATVTAERDRLLAGYSKLHDILWDANYETNQNEVLRLLGEASQIVTAALNPEPTNG